MEYNFERFEDKPRAMTGNEPYVSIFPYGKMYLNRRTIELLGEPDAVALFYDKRQSVIGIQGVPPSRHYAFRLNKKDKRSLGSTIAATSFFNHHKIRPSETLAFPNLTVNDEGIMILDLNDVVIASKKGK
jgi:hypothetical protein